MDVLRELYNSEINFKIETLWEGARVWLGDELNGFEVTANLGSYDKAVDWLATQAMDRYPDSNFARKMTGRPPLPSGELPGLRKPAS